MTPTLQEPTKTTERMDRHDGDAERSPAPWTAPDFVERSTCAEIGAYSFQQK
jgi:hypothetical protein